MKNSILFSIILLCGNLQLIECSNDNIPNMVAQLSEIPLHKNGNVFEDLDKKFYETIDWKVIGEVKGEKREKKLQKHENKLSIFKGILKNWKDEVDSEEKYIKLIYKYFRLIYDNQIRHIVEDWYNYTTGLYNYNHLYGVIKSYQDGYMKKLSPLFNDQCISFLQKANTKFTQDKDAITTFSEEYTYNFINFINENKNTLEQLLNYLELIKMFDIGSPGEVWSDKRYLAGKSEKIFSSSTFSILFETISKPLSQNNSDTRNILFTIKEMENEMLWRGLLFYFDPFQELTLDDVKQFFDKHAFEGKNLMISRRLMI